MADLENTSPSPAQLGAMRNRMETKAMQSLMGMVTGIVADEHLHDREIALLSTWLAEHREIAEQWPGSAIAAHLRLALADGIITEEERAHLLAVLSELAATDFAATGSATAEPMRLPIDDSQPVQWRDAGVVHTGEFMFGTRAQCERLTMALGGMPLDNVTKHTDVLVIGTRVSPHWLHESYGRKIMKAVDLRQRGASISIISEQRWLGMAQASGKI